MKDIRALLLMSSILSVPVLQAQEGGTASASLAEVVVTARKQEEKLSEAPIAVSAFTQAQLEDAGLRNLEDLAAISPGVQYSDQGGQLPGRYNSAVRFRGMDTNQQAASQQLGTVFLDGVYVSQGFSSLGFDNIERVEVLKGPQSATFGRSTFGGAINYITRTPSFTPTARLTADVAEFDTYDFTASYEGALIGDTVAMRIAGRDYSTNGQYKSASDGGRLGKESTRSAEFGLFGDFGKTTARFRVLYSEDEDGAPAGFVMGGAASNQGAGPNLHNCHAKNPALAASGLPDYFCGELPRVDARRLLTGNTTTNDYLRELFSSSEATATLTGVPRTRLTSVPDVDFIGLKRDALRAMLSANHDFDNGYSATVSGGYNKMRVNWIRDFDQNYVLNWFSSDPQIHEDYSVEARISSPGDSKFRYMIGASYFDVKYRQDTNGGTNVYNAYGQAPPFSGITTPIIFIEATPTETAETMGVFASASYDFTDRTTLTVDLRYQEDKISQDIIETAISPDYEDTFTSTLPRITLSHRFGENSTVWGTYSEGNLPGFFNTQIIGRSPNEIAQIVEQVGAVGLFNDEETLENFEVGYRDTYLDQRVTVALVSYYMRWRNQKTRVGVPIIQDSGAPTIASVQTNTGGSNLWGLEFELNAKLMDRLTGYATTNWAAGEYVTFICGFAPFYPEPDKSCEGNHPPRFPEWSGSVGLEWKDALTDNLGYLLRADATYTGKAYTDETNFAWYTPGTRVNLRAGLETEAWRAELYVLNVTDNDNYLAASRFSDFSTGTLLGFSRNQGLAVTPAEKRTVGMRLSYRF